MKGDEALAWIEQQKGAIVKAACQKYVDSLSRDLPLKAARSLTAHIDDRGLIGEVEFGLTSENTARAFAIAATHIDVEYEKAIDTAFNEKFKLGD